MQSDPDLLAWTSTRQAQRDNSRISPSAIHGGCLRQHAYWQHGHTPSDKDTHAADFGTLLHAGWSAMISERYDPQVRQPDVPVTIGDMHGTADDVDWTHRIVTDLKTVSGFYWDRLYALQTIPEGMFRQGNLYAHGLAAEHGGTWTFRVVLLNRETGRSFRMERPHDPDLAAADLAQARHGQDLIDASETPLDLPRPVDAAPEHAPCHWCPFRDECWTGDPDPTPLPDTAAAIQWASDYSRAAAEERAAGEKKRAARDALRTAEGEYGPYRVHWTTPKPSEVPDMPAIREILDAHGYDLPTTLREAAPRISVRTT
jgi:hypothetical protein